ncbi:Taperin [Liparis tanakae]|uniref:Taperin n=1 Tax=Liparis tanakae TaxID=230148 RepID=A0A4Z2H2Y9_9TELE|nr:Taperin [Liparis tanakae]
MSGGGGGGELRVLRQEPGGQESPRMPAWKREILERRKAKGGGGGSGGAGAADTSPGGGGAGSQRVNGEQTGNVNGGGTGAKRDGGPGGGSGRSYTITAASQHFSNNKEPRPADAERTPPGPEEDDGGRESLVLQESLGPLDENPFIKLEKERRRRQDRDNHGAARPVQHILELYGSVPGIRTIRADNIIIIESDPDYFPEAGGLHPGSKWQQNGVSSYSSLSDLLDRRGSAVTEIRAAEVVIYDTTLSKSEENLSTLGRPGHEALAYEAGGEGQGRVSRMLQKFDSNYGKLQKKSRSTENLLDLESGSGGRPRLRCKPRPDPVPKAWLGPAASGQPPSLVFQSPSSPKPKEKPKEVTEVTEVGAPHQAGPPPPVSSFRQWFEESGGHGAPVSPGDEPPDGSWHAKPARERGDWEGSGALGSGAPGSPTGPVLFKATRSSSDFEIRPSPKPDLTRIPDGDAQARALANLRLQSRNSFTVIPKRRPAAAPSPPTPTPAPSKRTEEKPPEDATRSVRVSPSLPVPPSPSPPPSPSHAISPAPFSPPAPSSPPASPTVPSPTPPTSPVPSDSPAPSSTPPPSPRDQLPVTNIDDLEAESRRRVPAPSPMAQRRKGNTFTVVPRRRAEPSEGPSSSPEPPQQDAAPSSSEAPPPQAPYAHLGSLLKKRYPAAEEIEVVGGYLSLERSCLAKTGVTGKKVRAEHK